MVRNPIQRAVRSERWPVLHDAVNRSTVPCPSDEPELFLLLLAKDLLSVATGTRKPDDGFRLIKRILLGGSWSNHLPSSNRWTTSCEQTGHFPFNTGGRQGNDGRRFSGVYGREFDLVVDQGWPSHPVPVCAVHPADRSVGGTRRLCDSSPGVVTVFYTMRSVQWVRIEIKLRLAVTARPTLPCPHPAMLSLLLLCVDDDVSARWTVTNKIRHGGRCTASVSHCQ